MGVFEEMKGKAKEAAGDVTDRADLQREGEAQASKGAEERKSTQAQAAAQEHEKKAELYGEKQSSAENS